VAAAAVVFGGRVATPLVGHGRAVVGGGLGHPVVVDVFGLLGHPAHLLPSGGDAGPDTPRSSTSYGTVLTTHTLGSADGASMPR
jgi:hypothetical protein